MTNHIRYYTTKEGDDWHPFDGGTPGSIFHAIMLEDGTIYDAINGFRNSDKNKLAELDRRFQFANMPSKVPVPYTEEIINIVLEKLELMFRRAAGRHALHGLQQVQLGMDVLADETRKLLKERRP